MHAILRRLETGERWWAAEAAFAAVAFLMLSLAAWAAREVVLLVHRAPPHPGSPLEFVVALLAVLCGCLGLACLVEGPGLFRLVPVPPRRLL